MYLLDDCTISLYHRYQWIEINQLERIKMNTNQYSQKPNGDWYLISRRGTGFRWIRRATSAEIAAIHG